MPVYLCGGCPTKVCNNAALDCQTQQVQHTNLVLDLIEVNGAHDSDFHAVVWDETTQTPIMVWYRTTASWTYHNSARIDATPEVIERAMVWYRARWIERAVARHDIEQATPKVGRRVRSLTTRGRNVGVCGTVAWTGPGRYRDQGTRLKVVTDGGDETFLDAHRVEVLDRQPADMAELRAHAPTLSVPLWGAVIDR